MTTRVVTEIAGLRAELDRARADGSTIGFVPTMGYLHDGHASLMRAAASNTDLVVASLFVNPLQFGADEDLGSYPALPPGRRGGRAGRRRPPLRTLGRGDVPQPSGPHQRPRRRALPRRWEGSTRPSHFAGMATVVTKLFSIVGACRAYFGEKDYQQLAIIRRFVDDLSIPVEVIGCPIVRAEDGLALSSRNTYLTSDQRRAATVLHRTLLERPS